MSEIITLFGGRVPEGGEILIGDDTADLLLSIQSTFHIQFDEHGVFPKTVGELSDLVIAKLKGTRSTKCLTSVTFYQVRSALMGVLGVGRDTIAPRTKLETMLDRGPHRRQQWKNLERRTGLRFPVLTHPVSMTIGMLIFAIGLATRFAVDGWTKRSLMASVFLVVACWLLALILWIVAYGFTQQLVWGLPRNCQTVGDLANLVLAKNYGTLSDEAGGWNEKEVWKALREFVADETAIDKDKVNKDTAFPAGLNIF